MSVNISVGDLFTYDNVVESPVPSSTMLSARQPPAEPLSSTALERTLQDLSLEQKLCETCKLLDFQKVFYASKDEYKFPDSPANFWGQFGNRMCWSLFLMRKEKDCRLCQLIMSTLRLNPRFEALEDEYGVVMVSRMSLYSKETDLFLPNFHFLSLEVSEGQWLGAPVSYGYAIGIGGTHKIRLPNTVKASLKHFYPWLPPGMIPMSTTDEQIKAFDAWRLETATEYEVSVQQYDASKADINMIKGWLKCCEGEHSIWCVKKMTKDIATVPGFRVIDVTSGNIVEQPEGCRYLALSYVWGQVHRGNDYLRLMKNNHQELKELGGVFNKLSRLPDTLKDAITLCQNLDERYLWIDSLCIIQDSPEDQMGQISRMDTIYRSAILTIVAAAGSDANAGLPGIRPELLRKTAPEASVGGFDLVTIPEDGESEISHSKWNSRAWTFQECVLSTRLLRFTSSFVTFECQSACWREDFLLEGPEADRFRLAAQERKEQEVRQNFHQIISADILQFENMVPRQEWFQDFRGIWMGCYGPLVRDYTKRRLTMESDMLNAFRGIEGALSRSLGEFSWGLPHYQLGPSLAWIATTDDVTRREGFPSFSWTGWVFGEGNWGSYPDYLRGPIPGLVLMHDDGAMKYWSEDCVDDIYIGIYEWHDALLYPSNVEMAKGMDKILTRTIEVVMNAEDEKLLSSVIFFWTSAAAVEPFAYEIEEDEDEDEWSESEERKEGPAQRTTILEGVTVMRQIDTGLLVGGGLTPSEMRSVSVQLESTEVDLVYIGSATESGTWCLLLISWKDGVASRILPQVQFRIDASEWEARCPTKKLVVLG